MRGCAPVKLRPSEIQDLMSASNYREDMGPQSLMRGSSVDDSVCKEV